MDQELVAILSRAKHLPADALRRAVREPEAVAEPVLAVVERAAADPDALDGEEADLLFWGVHALGAARDTRLCAPLLRLLRQDADALDALLGDAVTTTVARILAGVFDGDAAPFHALILDSSLDGFVRGEVLAALSFLTRAGRVPLAQTHDLLVRFDDKKAAVEEDVAWNAWEEAIAYLGLVDLVPRVEAARRDGRITDEFSDAAWFHKTLRQVTAEPPDFGEFTPQRHGTLDDPVAALDWTDERYGKPIVNPFKNVGRNDPCPCGSGKKFKKCCLNGPAVPPVTLPGLR